MDHSMKAAVVDLALADAEMLARGTPWRVFRWRQGQAHYSGWYWASTMGRHVVYESRLELARLLVADFDRNVVIIAAQPFCVTAPDGDRERRHVPDFLLIDADSGVTVVNVKPAGHVENRKVAEALTWAGRLFADKGWRHEVWSGADPVMLANVRFLAGYRHGDRVDIEAVHAVDELVGAATSIGAVEQVLGRRFGRQVSRPALLHLIWRGSLRADLHTPLCVSTLVERAA